MTIGRGVAAPRPGTPEAPVPEETRDVVFNDDAKALQGPHRLAALPAGRRQSSPGLR